MLIFLCFFFQQTWPKLLKSKNPLHIQPKNKSFMFTFKNVIKILFFFFLFRKRRINFSNCCKTTVDRRLDQWISESEMDLDSLSSQRHLKREKNVQKEEEEDTTMKASSSTNADANEDIPSRVATRNMKRKYNEIHNIDQSFEDLSLCISLI